MLKLSRLGPHEWRFVYPSILQELMQEFNTGCELNEEDRRAGRNLLGAGCRTSIPEPLFQGGRTLHPPLPVESR
jgi:hypothetical protein